MESGKMGKNSEREQKAGGVSQKHGFLGRKKQNEAKKTPSGISTKGKVSANGAGGACASDAQAPKKSKFLKVFICAFLAVVIIFGATVAIIMNLRHADAVVYADGVYINEGVANYFASQYKVIYLAKLNGQQVVDVKDTEEFWSRKADDGKTYGDKFLAGFKSYLTEIIAGNIIFNKYAEIGVSDERIIENTINAVVRDRADGSVERFDEIAKTYGFTYDEFCEAAEMQYKYDMSRLVIYGEDGKNLESGLAKEYYKNYTHVQIAFIRTDYLIEMDENTGAYTVYNELSVEELSARLEQIANYKEYIDNLSQSEGGKFTTSHFEEIISAYPENTEVDYYFYKEAEETALISETFPELVEMSYSLKSGGFGYVEFDIPADESIGYSGFKGVCFVYKNAGAAAPYENVNNKFFSDFYEDASKYFFARDIVEYSSDAEFTELYDEVMRPLSIPKNNELYIFGWVSG